MWPWRPRRSARRYSERGVWTVAQQTLERDPEIRSDAALPNGRKKSAAGKGKKMKAPEKRTLNLAFKDKRTIDWKKAIVGVLAVLILAGVFGKFAVADRFDKLSQAESDLAAMRDRLEQTRDAYTDYDEVREQYNRYNYTGFDKTIVDRLDVLDILERKIFPVCSVTSFSVSGRTVTLSLTELDLNKVSQLIVSLEAEPLVERVYVPVANEGNAQGIGTASMTIYLVDATTVEEGEAQ